MDYDISTDPNRLDLPLIHEFLSNSYWAKGRPMEVVERSIENSLCFGAYHNDRQIAFARLITDRAVFAYLADVFVIEKYRGRGISTMLISEVLKHPDIQGVQITLLATKDARNLYEKFGFKRVNNLDKMMAIYRHEVDDKAP